MGPHYLAAFMAGFVGVSLVRIFAGAMGLR